MTEIAKHLCSVELQPFVLKVQSDSQGTVLKGKHIWGTK